MSFPNIIFGSYGDERVTQSTKIGDLPLGARMVLPDGRMYAHAKAGGAALVAGKLTMGENTVNAHDTNLELPAAVAVGATTLTVTLATTAVTEDQYADGYLIVNDGTPEGQIYKIKGCNSAASTEAATISIEGTDGLVTAFKTATTEIGLRVNEFQGCLLWDHGAVVGIPAGIPPVDVAINYYFWVQRRGVAGYLDEGGGTLGESLVASTGTDGGLETWAGSGAATTWENEPLGWCHTVQGDGEYGAMYLTLD